MKSVSPSAIVKRIQHDLDRVVIEDISPPRHPRPHLGWIIETYEHHVQVLLVVAQICLGSLRRGIAIVRVSLYETCNFDHLGRICSCRHHTKKVFQWRWIRQPRDEHLRIRSGKPDPIQAKKAAHYRPTWQAP